MSPGANLNAYIQGTATVPILTQDEERKLGEALYYQDDLDAARRLVMSHLRFVVHIARSYNGYGHNHCRNAQYVQQIEGET